MSLDACISRWPATTRWPWLLYLLAPTKRLRTDASASFTCRNSGSESSRPSIKTIQQRVPTLPTPTTLRAMSANSYCSSRNRRSVSSVRRYLAIRLVSCAWKADRSASLGISSSSGTSSGGSAMIRGLPSTMRVSLATSCMLSLVRALARPLSTSLRCRSFSWDSNCTRIWSRSACAYQTSRLVMPAKLRIACR